MQLNNNITKTKSFVVLDLLLLGVVDDNGALDLRRGTKPQGPMVDLLLLVLESTGAETSFHFDPLNNITNHFIFRGHGLSS